MQRTMSLAWLALLALYHTLIVAAASQKCTSSDVMRFASIFDFPPTQAYCSRNYPNASQGASTTTCDPNALQPQQHNERRQSPFLRHGFGDPHVADNMPEAASDPEQTFMLLLQQEESAVSTVCSCLAEREIRPTPLVKCTAGHYCDPSSGQCKPQQRDCSNPARCDGNSLCGRGARGDHLFCHHDTDRGDAGYCMNDGPPGRSCPEATQYEDCSSNADCGGRRVCIYACCREEPFCVDVSEYRDASYTSLSVVK